MIDTILSYLSLPFIQRALIAGGLISLCCALLGVSLVLKNFSMIGDGLSHVGFGALAIAAAANLAPLAVAIPVSIVAAFLLMRLGNGSRLRGDAGIAVISTTALAIGVLVISNSGKSNVDLSSYMFGSLLSVDGTDLTFSIILAVAVLLIFLLFYNRIFAVTFDEDFAKATGTSSSFYNMLIASLTAVTVVLGMRLVGALLISALIIFPPLISMTFSRSFLTSVVFSAVISLLCFVVGFLISLLTSSSPGAVIVCVNAGVYLLISFVNSTARRKKRTKVRNQ